MGHSTISLPMIGLAVAMVFATTVRAQPTVVYEDAKVVASDAQAFDYFGNPFTYVPPPTIPESGTTVAIDGEVMVVGAHGDDDLGSYSGSVYVFRFDGVTWIEEQKLTASDGVAGDKFGSTVALDGDVLVVGSTLNDSPGTESGAAYVFRHNGAIWIEEQKLTASDAVAGEHFGWAVDICDDVILIGADWDDDAGDYSGSAYIFRHDGVTWVEEQKLVASDAATSHVFGYSVAICGDVAVVGAPYDDTLLVNAGSAYIYRLVGATWVEEQKISADDPASEDLFARSIDLDGDRIVVGSPLCERPPLNLAGAAYVYEYSGGSWDQTARLEPMSIATGDLHGFSVRVSGDTLLVCSRNTDFVAPGTGSGVIYLHNGVGWVETKRLLASDAAQLDVMGVSAAMDGDVIVLAAGLEDDGGTDAGAVYVFGSITTPYVRGEINGDGTVDISDGVFLLAALFIPGAPPSTCLDASDVNDDGANDVSDAVYLLGWLFISGAEPPAPFPNCGNDASPDPQDCAEYLGTCP
ncbi:MAG: hypothetical protein KDC38_15225 [Planctomycetes bacterium]|nr:hypothetical protein [Planctomycetota bacterium]